MHAAPRVPCPPSAIERCLGAATQVDAADTAAQWWPGWLATGATPAPAIERAIAAGFAADRVGWAFAAGYQAALQALVPGLPADTLASFCVTEASGNRPRDIQTTVAHCADGSISIHGSKRWATLGPVSTLLLVVGRELPAEAAGQGTERLRLRVVRVPAGTPGLVLQDMPATPFVPEVPHARVQLDDVRLPEAALLPGDGYTEFVKPFRTLEDTHVTAAVLAYLLREARARGWPAEWRERLLAALMALSAIGARRADASATHLALEGALRWAHRLYAEADALWAGEADEAAARWQRDVALFEVAGAARARRATLAWERLAQQGVPDG